MKVKVDLSSIYAVSEDVVAREISGEFIIVPITHGAGDEIFSLNESGKAIWDRLNGKRSLEEIRDCLSKEFDASQGEVEKDLVGFVKELLKRKILVKN